MIKTVPIYQIPIDVCFQLTVKTICITVIYFY